jgi:crotonobetainyl-CoA:carnitine CoA-transferase CaiB-like acyl-CoA transferase
VILTDWGAEVLKIEHPVFGDPQRNITAWGVPAQVDGVTHLFEVANRGKQSMGLDISQPEGHDILMRLVDESDVFVTNFLPPARRKLRIEPEDILGRNPRIVYARGSAQGPRGDDAERGGFDAISYWGKSGASVGVTPPEHPWPLAMPGPGFGDLQSGMAMAGAIAAGLFQRERTGRGTVVDVSLMSVGIWAMGMTISGTSMLDTDTLPHQYREERDNPLVNMYRTSDGHMLSLAFLQSDRYWPEFCVLAGRDDLLADERFTDAAGREQHSRACIQILEELFAERTLAEWKVVLEATGGQWDVLLPPGRVAYDPQVQANGYVQRVHHEGRSITLVPAPAQFDGVIAEPGRAPALGSATEATLQRHGLDETTITQLRERSIVR